MLTPTEITALFAQHHNPALVEVEGHVYKIWEDGEVTMEKCGSLYGHRSCHMIEYGQHYSLALDLMPVQQGNGHGYVIATHEGVFAIRRAIWPSAPEVSYAPPPRVEAA